MTTFIDFRYSRALAAALFTGQEKEEATVEFPAGCDTSVALDIGGPGTARRLAVLMGGGGDARRDRTRRRVAQ